MTSKRIIQVEELTRVEGEGGLYVRLHDGSVDEVRLDIYEPPRMFEAFLRGRNLEDVPDITARICGICPVAYQMSSVHALEAALDVVITPEIRKLRRLLYCGEWIESHALHMYLLHAPDFLGYDSALDMAQDYPEQVNRGLRLKKHGNELLEILGGRAIHPINVAVGGFYRCPRREPLQRLIPDLQWGLEAAVETTRWVAGFEFPDFQPDYELVSLVHPQEYPFNEGMIGSSQHPAIPVAQFESVFEERHVPHSTALHSLRKEGETSYLVGPLARVSLNFSQLSPLARQIAEEVGISWPCRNPFQSIVARGLELIHAHEEALRIIGQYQPASPPRIRYEYHAGQGCSATEAPRGTLYHRYAVDELGKVTAACIIPPTSQNQARMEEDLKNWVPQVLSDDDAVTARQCENLLRTYDPCISCSTHFMKVNIERA